MLKSFLNRLNSRKGRFFLLSLIPVGIFLIFFARLVFIQVINHDAYVKEATKLRVKSRTLYAKRGQIYFKSGATGVVPAVLNERTWLIFVDPSYVADKNKVQVELDKILGDQMITSWDNVWKDMSLGYVPVAKDVNYETVTKVKEANLQGVGQQETSKRIYPQNTMAAQVLGFVNGEGVGSGIEGALNDRLSGKDGLLKTVTDVNSIPLSIGDENIERNLNLTNGLIMAERLMAELTRAGMGKQTAYGIVRKNAIKANKEKLLLGELILEDEEVQKYLTEEDVEKIMDPHTYIGSIPTIIDELLEESESWF